MGFSNSAGRAGAALGLVALLGTAPAWAASGKAELLFTPRSDDVSETNISAEEQRLLDLIDLETVAIKASIDGLSRDNVVNRLISAHQRGVGVQVTADCEIVVADASPAYRKLMDAGIPVVDDNNTYDGPTVNPGCTSNQTSGFVHNKFFIFKGQQTVWTGSTNMTDYAFNSAQNAILLLSGNADVVAFYEAEFNHMFGNGLSLRDGGTGKFGRQKTLNPGIGKFTLADGTAVEVAFSPYNYNTTPDTLAQVNGRADANDADCAGPFVCGASTCKASGATCSSGSECCSGTCYNGRTKTCK